MSPCWSVSSSREERQRSSRFWFAGASSRREVVGPRRDSLALCFPMLFSRERKRELGERVRNPWSLRGFTLLSMICRFDLVVGHIVSERALEVREWSEC